MSWLTQTLIGTLFLVPAIIAIGFTKRVFGVPADVFMIWYYLGITITIIFMSLIRGETLSRFVNYPILTLGIMILVGLTVGAGANIFTFSAYASAPNAGIVQALQELAVPGLFFLTLFLAKVFPLYFKGGDKISFGWGTLAIILMLAGTYIIIFKAKPDGVEVKSNTTSHQNSLTSQIKSETSL